MRRYVLYALLLYGFAFSHAHAKNWQPTGEEDPLVMQWYASQHDREGNYCCDGSDAFSYEGIYDLNQDGSVTLHAGPSTIKVEATKVINNKNPTGHPVWWHNTVGYTYCFALGTLG